MSGAFFLAFWGKDAGGLGRDDMGLALALSFAVPLALYASQALAAVLLLAALVARARGRPLRLWLAALAVALLPLAFLLLRDPRP